MFFQCGKASYSSSLKCHPSSLPYPPEEGRGAWGAGRGARGAGRGARGAGRERREGRRRASPLGGKEERTDDISD